VQANVPTIQGELERALATVCREQIRIVGAGRTDAGVHATGQVISFRSATGEDPQSIRRGVNALLPEDIAIRDVEEAGEDFHARFSATGRTYEYRIRCAPQRDPLERHREHWVPQALDASAMERAAARLVGRMDFASFAMAGMRTTVREVRRAELHREDARLRFEIEADAFLRGMVRAIVGTLLWVGRGTMTEERFAQALASRDRAQAGPSAPAQGLCLIRVEYEGASGRSEQDADDEE
jgi:tRNA pseudouridine38-40 synthase